MFTVFIAADIEGTTGYVDWPEKPPEGEWFRKQMTAEVNAAIEGALSGGADSFIVSDIHWKKQNIIPDLLSGRAALIRGTKRRLMWMDMVGRSNLVFLIGFHAGCGAAGAVLPHTMTTRITELKINGRHADEALISAFTAGHFRVPVGLASGDKSFIDEVLSFLPELETVVVKEGIGNCAALNIHPAQALESIKEAAEKAAQRGIKGCFKPFICAEPVELIMEVSWPGYAEALSLIPGVRRSGGREVFFKGKWLEVMNILSLFVNYVPSLPVLC